MKSVGVSLGKNEKEIMVSTNALKYIEFDHVKVTPKFPSKSNTTHLDEEELHARVEGQLLSHLVGEVSEVGLDEAMLSFMHDVKASSWKSKSNSVKNNKRPCKKDEIIQISKCFLMDGMFTNSRGLRDLARHLHIMNCVRVHNLDFASILEVGGRDFTMSLLIRLSGGLDCTWMNNISAGAPGSSQAQVVVDRDV
jgi:hypothetical protein